MMTGPQDKMYWSLWAQLRRASPDLLALKGEALATARRDLHVRLGLPASHTKWGRRGELDAWKAHVNSIARTHDLEAQMEPAQQPAKRARWEMGNLCRALGEGEDYGARIFAQMNRGQKVAGAESTLDDLAPAQLEVVLTALRAECHRRWPKAVHVREEIGRLMGEQELTAEVVRSAVAEALKVPLEALPESTRLGYDRLITALAAVRNLCRVEVPF